MEVEPNVLELRFWSCVKAEIKPCEVLNQHMSNTRLHCCPGHIQNVIKFKNRRVFTKKIALVPVESSDEAKLAAKKADL
ncbi:hypothetical protein BpHYR1_050455 [Brachionus plicatilis]|uniref:Uncharacterized protein n=1 Tax=Brachionus plicatilis TaxID=10195 RepID=A0A3M7QG74_BRAPC|nr:hypothetical protein BpHYR1_050455 [Brachionus plicatilis]